MHIIQNNPYRIVGLLVGATAALQNRHIKRIPIFIDAGDKIPEEFTTYSFPKLGEINLTVDSVNEASSKLNLDSDKMRAALFWFYNGNEITDEVAFEAMKDGNESRAVEIWRSLAYDDNGEYKIVTQRNASAFHNLATYYLNEYGIDDDALQLELFFLDSEYSKDLITKATDEFNPISQKDLQILFLNTLSTEDTDADTKIMEAIPKIEFSAKEDFLKEFVKKPIEQIEKKIEESKSKRKANKANSRNAVNSLFADTKDSVKQLKSILEATNIKYSSIADKLAMEFFACGRDYFMHFKDTDTDPSSVVMKIFSKAETLAVGNIAKQRCQENIENLQEWIEEKPERDRLKLIEKDLRKLVEIFEDFERENETIENAVKIIRESLLFLKNIRTQVGRNDPVYLKLSTKVASMAQHNIIEEVNRAQESAEGSNLSFITLPPIFSKAWDASELVGQLDMDIDFRNEQYSRNRNILKDICQTLRVDIRPVEVRLNEKLRIATNEMNKIKEWQFLRNDSERQSQINVQQRKLDLINARLRNNKAST
jgi:hypothetical protein